VMVGRERQGEEEKWKKCFHVYRMG
jgi:hypothetical protein